MGPIKATIHCMTHPFTWDERATRSEFWWFALMQIFVGAGVVAAVIAVFGGQMSAAVLEMIAESEALGLTAEESDARMYDLVVGQYPAAITAYMVFNLYLFFASLSVTIRRLHDTGRSGWWYLICLVPFIGGIWLLVLLVLPSDDHKNEWGPPSAYTPEQAAKFEARRARNLEAYMQPRSEIDVHDTPDAVRALRHSRMPTA